MEQNIKQLNTRIRGICERQFGPWIIFDQSVKTSFGNIWIYLAYNSWKLMAMHGNSWQLMVTHGNWAAGTFENWCGACPHGLRAGREVAEGHQMQKSWLEVGS